MLSAFTGDQIRAAEAPLLEAGLGNALMQRAAHGLYAAAVAALVSATGRSYGRTVVVLAGSGNNGGDALFAGARLAKRGSSTTAVLTSDRTHPEALAAFEAAGGRVERLSAESTGRLAIQCTRAHLIIDGILGTGARGGLREPAAGLVRELEAARAAPARAGRSRAVVVACDLPSGVDVNTGVGHNPILGADVTVTFGGMKTGLLMGEGAWKSGRIVTGEIGLGSLGDPSMRRLESSDLADLYPQPQPTDHKYSRGVLGIAAGSDKYPGAAVLATGAALATGVGMVRYLGPPSVAALIHATHPEAVCSQGSVGLSHVQAWLVGPGAEEDPGQRQRARDAISSGLPTVVDAGALPLLPKRVGPHVILTPHAGELQALLARRRVRVSREDIETAPAEFALKAAELTGATVLLKGFVTVVAAPTGELFSQANATPWLATAGSGDTLAGILGALAATLTDEDDDAVTRLGLSPTARWAVVGAAAAVIHGLAGTRAAERGPVVVSNLPRDIGAAIADLLRPPVPPHKS
ncbi:NAD(P)H-hydrate epimerase [Arthrobacter sp. H5]|uniref:NAD(P)H-hydrate epimerase n=1 Tax=Arthrobacter sp. H5 TaxID=1267973 RepID=UPI000484F720|nr:NAD(P)H-hydrate epimerase [Arthrobacter sp. H5]